MRSDCLEVIFKDQVSITKTNRIITRLLIVRHALSCAKSQVLRQVEQETRFVTRARSLLHASAHKPAMRSVAADDV